VAGVYSVVQAPPLRMHVPVNVPELIGDMLKDTVSPLVVPYPVKVTAQVEACPTLTGVVHDSDIVGVNFDTVSEAVFEDGELLGSPLYFAVIVKPPTANPVTVMKQDPELRVQVVKPGRVTLPVPDWLKVIVPVGDDGLDTVAVHDEVEPMATGEGRHVTVSPTGTCAMAVPPLAVSVYDHKVTLRKVSPVMVAVAVRPEVSETASMPIGSCENAFPLTV